MRPADATFRLGRAQPALLARVAVVLVVVVAAALGAPDPVLRVGVLVSLALAAEQLAHRRGRGVAEALAVAGGSLLAGTVLVGLVLDHVGAGFATRGWALGLGSGALVVLLVGLLAGPEPRDPTAAATPWTSQWGPSLRSAGRVAPWVIASLVVVALAAGLASRPVEQAAPPAEGAVGVAMAFGSVSGTDVDVVVTAPAGSSPTPYALRVAVGGSEITYPVFTLGPGRPQTSRVAVPATGRYEVALVDPGTGVVVRMLTLAR